MATTSPAPAWNFTKALTSPNHSLSNSQEVMQFRHIIRLMDYYLVPMIIIVGLLGNTVSCLVFLKTNLRILSSSVYLAALAISDNGFLLCVFASWGTNVGVSLYHTAIWCQMFVYCQYVFSFLSVWYIVGFTVERFIAIRFPFKRGAMCTVRRAKIVVVLLTLVAIVFYSFSAWTAVVERNPYYGSRLCMPDDRFHNLLSIMNSLDTFITFVVPCMALIVLNLSIACAVARFQGQRLQITQTSNGLNIQQALYSKPDHGSIQRRAVTADLRSKGQVKVTKLLLVVSTIFLVLNLPSHSLRFYSLMSSFIDPDKPPPRAGSIYYGLEKLFINIFYVNFAINFFLYNLCGNNFRVALKQLFHKFINLCSKRIRKGSFSGDRSRTNSTSVTRNLMLGKATAL